MNSEEDEFRRIETEAKRRAAGDDGIIRMAREAGWDINDLIDVFDFGVRLEAFANLVAKHEREACEMAVEDIARKYQQAHEVSAENVADACAYAIRARGQA